MALVAVYLYEDLSLVSALIAVLIARGFSDKQSSMHLGSHDIQPPVLANELVPAFLI